jgi:hypothetical protein
MVLSVRLIVNSLCIAVFLFSLKAVATDDTYLKMLEGEEVQLDKSGQLKDNESETDHSSSGITKKLDMGTWEGDLEGDVLPPGLAQDEFASLLKQNFYGSFVYYRKLNSLDQQTVYYHYTKASPANLDDIRQDILDHLKR